MKISSINIFRYNNKKTNNAFNHNLKITSKNDCFQLSFEGKNLKKTIDKIGKENFPSTSMYNFALEKSLTNPEELLYQLHTEFYRDLLDCSTLEEAKELYPEEFKDVINASELPKESLPMGALKPILNGEVEDITLDNLTLNILKQYYGKKVSTKDRNTYFLIGIESLSKLMAELNIKRFASSYENAVTHSKPEFIKKATKNSKNYYDNNSAIKEKIAKRMRDTFRQNPEKKENISKKLKQYYENNPEARENISKKMKGYYENNPEAREKQSQKLKEVYKQNPQYGELLSQHRREYYAIEENRQKHSERLKEFHKNHPEARIENGKKVAQYYIDNPQIRQHLSEKRHEFYKNHPEYIEAMKEAWKRHPEITSKMSDISGYFDGMPKIFQKLKSKEKLTESEDICYKRYTKSLETILPNYKKTIMTEYHNILIEKGLIED